MNVAAGPKLAAAVTNAGQLIYLYSVLSVLSYNRWYWGHWRCSPKSQIPSRFNQRTQEPSRGQERTVWRRSLDPASWR